MQTVKYTIGAVKSYSFILYDNGDPLDVTDGTPTLEVVDDPIMLTPILTKVGTITNGTGGIVSFDIAATDFKAAKEYYYRVKIELLTGFIDYTEFAIFQVNK